MRLMVDTFTNAMIAKRLGNITMSQEKFQWDYHLGTHKMRTK
jgi:hypothetical protein